LGDVRVPAPLAIDDFQLGLPQRTGGFGAGCDEAVKIREKGLCILVFDLPKGPDYAAGAGVEKGARKTLEALRVRAEIAQR
jgi:hypothetical protein